MKRSIILLVAALSGAILTACSTAPPTESRPVTSGKVVISPMGFGQKMAYLANVKATLKEMLQTAQDLQKRQKPDSLLVLGREAAVYLQRYVTPLLQEQSLRENPETQLEIGKVALLAAAVCCESGQTGLCRNYLQQLNAVHGGSSIILDAELDRSDIGYGSLKEGVNDLQRRLWR